MYESCSDESSGDEETKVLFMGIENGNPGEDSEWVVDLEYELISDFEELRKYRRRYKKLKTKKT